MWIHAQAVELCRKIEAIAPRFGAHVALTGGTLYKEGARKDADIMFYRIRQVSAIDEEGLLRALHDELGMMMGEELGWVQKAIWQGKQVDLFFPERPDPPQAFWFTRNGASEYV